MIYYDNIEHAIGEIVRNVSMRDHESVWHHDCTFRVMRTATHAEWLAELIAKGCTPTASEYDVCGFFYEVHID